MYLRNDKIPTIKDYLNDSGSTYDSYIYGLESGLEWASEHYFRISSRALLQAGQYRTSNI